jgi:Ni/Co efflux regulator RcnB
MRKMMIMALMAAAAMPAMAQAQSAAEVRHDNREVRDAQRDLARAQAYGDHRDVRDARSDLRDARQERREDWRDYRQAHRDVYRRPQYVGPRGYAYRPVNVGYRFQPHYYSSQYVIADPWRYRLARPAGYNRWVRYGNDVVLVNIRTGRVQQVYNGFFW